MSDRKDIDVDALKTQMIERKTELERLVEAHHDLAGGSPGRELGAWRSASEGRQQDDRSEDEEPREVGEGGPAIRCGLEHGLHHARAFEVLVSKAVWWMSVLAEHRPRW